MRRDDPFEAMLHRYRGLIFSLCRRYARRGAEAEDLVQEASIALWKAREQLLGLPLMQQAAMVWKVARNAVVDTLRRTPQTEALPEGFEMEGDDRSLLQELHERIALLDEPDRSIVRLQLEGYSYEEIGEQVGMTEKNVSVRLVRIKDKLRKNMAI
ncbi:MAG: sigma-70 family RNA polymerase sigma factor [Bacteroidales bacterium]|nr:sigma-70 family RNA polymerase sigma factor [Bacteroidales bacterium]